MKKTFTQVLFICLSSLFASAQSIDTTGLIAYYPFTGNANDSSGHQNHGSVYFATLAADRFGNPNSAYSFNGYSSYILSPSSQSLESPATTGQITMTAWVLLKGLSKPSLPFGPIIEKTNSSPDVLMYRMGIDENYKGVYSTYNRSTPFYHTVYPIDTGKWYFIATTFSNAGHVKFYINGQLIETDTSNLIIQKDSNPLVIGKDAQGLSEYFDGFIDEVGIYNRVLSDAEVQNLYTGSILPVTFTSFSVKQQANSNMSLIWHTANEINTDHYIIERSADAIHFEVVSSVASKNSPAGSYSYEDAGYLANLSGNTVYYRIKQVDKDGKTSYSPVVQAPVTVVARVVLYPNPAISYITLQLQTIKADNIRVRITDMAGKVLIQQSYRIGAGSNSLPLNVASLANNTYRVMIDGTYTKAKLSFVKQ